MQDQTSDTTSFSLSQLSCLSACLPVCLHVCLDCWYNYRPGKDRRGDRGSVLIVRWTWSGSHESKVCKDVLSLICCHKSLPSTSTYNCYRAHSLHRLISLSLCLSHLSLTHSFSTLLWY